MHDDREAEGLLTMTTDDAAPLPFADSLCHRCRLLRVNGNKRGSIFLSCTAPTLPRYLPQPVRACAAFTPG